MPAVRAKTPDPLATYREKRDFRATPEPRGRRGRKRGFRYLIQKHDARRLHYDFRLELDGVLKSWAVTRGPSLDPSEKRLAVRTEDHPLDYGEFEGVIPKGYGAGTVLLWDTGTWQPQGDPHEGLRRGSLKFTVAGKRLRGGFVLVRMKKKPTEKRENWLLIKERDQHADATREPTRRWTDSIRTGRDLRAVEAGQVKGGDEHRTERSPSKGVPRSMPTFVQPQLATLRAEPPSGRQWMHEIKYDGYRLQALLAGGDVRLLTRNRKDWTARYPAVARAVAQLEADTAALDGELVALDAAGRSDFGALQNVSERDLGSLVYYAFDLLELDGRDLRREPLRTRKEQLRKLIGKRSRGIRFSDHIEGAGDEVVARACRMALEGIISKRADRPYRSGRSTDWIKTKCVGHDEFVVGGYRRSDKHGRAFASLLVGEYVNGQLVYRGRVGTGFDDTVLDDLSRRLERLPQKNSPFADLPAAARRGAVWVKPDLVAQIAYAERTADGLLRHASFQGLREDKTAREVSAPSLQQSAGHADSPCGVKLTNPDKVLYPDLGLTKRELAAYYLAVADDMLPHLAGRPVSLVRCPTGRSGKCFFHKHFNESTPAHLKCTEIAEKDGTKKPYLLIDDEAGLVAAAQIGALELHVWGARADRIERPERIVFDLDPGGSVSFEQVRSAALELRDLLRAAGLQTFALLTGGKGIHVIAPLVRRNDWQEVKSFARDVANGLATAAPRRFIATAAKARREGRIFIDWLRNERGATAVLPYSTRARAGAPVAVPVSWTELQSIESASRYDVHGVHRRLATLKSDPWTGYGDIRQSLTGPMQRKLQAAVLRSHRE